MRNRGHHIPMKRSLTSRLTAIPRQKIALLAGVLLCLAYFAWHNIQFPLIDDSLSKQEATAAAVRYLGLDGDSVKTAVTYDADQSIIAYLQKEQLLEAYMDIYDPAYPLDYYRVEIEDAERTRYEAIVHLYEGTIAGWQVETAVKRYHDSSLSDEQSARQAAVRYLRAKHPGDLTGSEISSYAQPDGTYLIRFELPHERIGEAYRIAEVQVAGDTVISYQSRFIPPDDFVRWLQEQDARADKFTNITFMAGLGMAVAALAIAIFHRRRVRLSDGLGLMFILVVIETIRHLNMLPSSVSMLEARQAGPIMLSLEMLFAATFMTMFSFTIYLPYLGGKAMLIEEGREHLVSRSSGDEWRRIVRLSYGLAIFILAAQTLIFHTMEANFHIWWIPDPTLSTDNMLWPLAMPLTAWTAAISEEIVYRLFAYTLFKKLLRSSWVAALLSSMIWALGHTAYPVYPVYTRFVEVTIIGLIFTVIFTRFGFAAAVLTHAVVDSILMGLHVASVGIGGVLAMIIYIALPALIGYYLAYREKLKTAVPTSPHASSAAPPPPRFR